MDSNKRSNETEMGSGDSDDEFYNVKFPYNLEVASDRNSKKVEVKKVYSPPRTKVQYDYKFDSSSDEESETRSSHKDSQYKESSKSSEKKSEGKEESSKENINLPQNTFKVVEKINEELKNMKNSGTKLAVEKKDSLTNHIVTSDPTTVSIPRPSIGVVPPVVVVPPSMVVPQAPVMGPMIVPSALSMGGPMAMMQSQSMMGNMIRSQNPIGITSNAISNSMMGMSAVPGMMSVQGNFMGVAGGMISPAAMGAAINMGMPGNMMRMPVAGNGMFRMQGPGNNILGLQGANNMMGISRHNNNLVGVPRPVNIPPPPNSLMVSNPIMTSTGGLMTMASMMSNRGVIINSSVAGTNPIGNSVGSNNMVQIANSSQGNLPVRVPPPPPPPFLNFRGRPSVPPGNLRWQTNTKMHSNIPKVDSPTVSSPSIPSPSSSPIDKSNKDYEGDEFSRDDKDKSPSLDTDESQSPPREIPNTFKNDGSFMEMFKKMTEESENNQEASSSNDKSGHSETSDSSSAIKKPAVMISGIVGKRRGGRVLKTGLVKKVKKEGEAEEEKHPKDAWSMYMAEVKKYREASCEEEGKTRPKVKSKEAYENPTKTYLSERKAVKPFKKKHSLTSLFKRSFNKKEPEKKMTIERDRLAAKFDPRFPNTNQTKNCYQNYLDFHRCSKKKGESFEACQYFKKVYKVLCPNEWVEKWNEQIENGVFPGRI